MNVALGLLFTRGVGCRWFGLPHAALLLGDGPHPVASMTPGFASADLALSNMEYSG